MKVSYEKITELASLCLDFGKVNRMTAHQDGVTHESDTDHTVMLGIMAGAIAAKLYPHLDRGLITQFALLHDLVEVYAGDTPTLRNASREFLESKKERETVALQRIHTEFGSTFPWITETIEQYERLDTPEARFIKVLDKIVPKVTAVLNNAKMLNDLNVANRAEASETFTNQRLKLQALAHDMPELLDLWEHFVEKELALINP